MKVPEAFRRIGGWHLVRKGYEACLGDWLEAARAAGAAPPIAGEGRAAVRRLTLADGGRAVVKHYRHGGLLRGLLRDGYWQRPPRPWRELAATEAARAAGVLAPEVLAALVRPLGRTPPHLWLYRGDLVTRELPGRVSLGKALRAAAGASERRAWLASAAQAMARLHQAGIRHPDLSVGNFLVGTSPEEPIAIIDFDRAVAGHRPVGMLGRWAARRRLSRSVDKLLLPSLDRRSVAALLQSAVREEPI